MFFQTVGGTADYEDYKEALRGLKEESTNLEAVVRMIDEFEPKFECLSSVNDKWEWILTEARKMFGPLLLKNILYVLHKSDWLGGRKDELVSTRAF